MNHIIDVHAHYVPRDGRSSTRTDNPTYRDCDRQDVFAGTLTESLYSPCCR